MIGEVAFRFKEYGEGNNEAVALVAGFAGGPEQLEQAARGLVDTGRDVVLYTYPPDVLLEGNGDHLPSLVYTLGTDFDQRSAGHRFRRYGGVSLGGAIAASMQKECPDPESGIYAATGINIAKLVIRPSIFRLIVKNVHGIDVRHAFEANGYTLDDLEELWQGINTPPDTAFSLVLGGLDLVVTYRQMRHRLATWHSKNPDIHARTLPRLGHNGTIDWFNANCTELLAA